MHAPLFLTTAALALVASAAPAPNPQFCTDRPPPCTPGASSPPVGAPTQPLNPSKPGAGNWGPAIPPASSVPISYPVAAPNAAPAPNKGGFFGFGNSKPKESAPPKDKPYIQNDKDGFTIHGPMGTFHKGPDGTVLKGGLGEYSSIKGDGTTIKGGLGEIQKSPGGTQVQGGLGTVQLGGKTSGFGFQGPKQAAAPSPGWTSPKPWGSRKHKAEGTTTGRY